MKNYVAVFLLLGVVIILPSCKKVFQQDESLPLTSVRVRTVLKNHTPGLDYSVKGKLEVGAELIIEPGVEIGMEPGSEIIVDDTGTLHANGTAVQKVVFRPFEEGGKWNGISIASLKASVFTNVVVEGASQRGSGAGALEVAEGGKLELMETEITGSGSASAVAVDAGGTCNVKSGCNFQLNFAPIQINFGANITIGSNNSLRGNYKDVIFLKKRNSGVLTIKERRTLEKGVLPYLAGANIQLNDGNLEIAKGVQLQFAAGSGLLCSDAMSRLNILGTQQEPVEMLNDVSVWKAKQPTWVGISITKGYAYLRHVKLSDITHPYQGAVTVGGYGELNMANCTITNYVGKCSILQIGYLSRVNDGIGIQNIFVKSPGFCSI